MGFLEFLRGKRTTYYPPLWERICLQQLLYWVLFLKLSNSNMILRFPHGFRLFLIYFAVFFKFPHGFTSSTTTLSEWVLLVGITTAVAPVVVYVLFQAKKEHLYQLGQAFLYQIRIIRLPPSQSLSQLFSNISHILGFFHYSNLQIFRGIARGVGVEIDFGLYLFVSFNDVF